MIGNLIVACTDQQHSLLCSLFPLRSHLYYLRKHIDIHLLNNDMLLFNLIFTRVKQASSVYPEVRSDSDRSLPP